MKCHRVSGTKVTTLFSRYQPIKKSKEGINRFRHLRSSPPNKIQMRIVLSILLSVIIVSKAYPQKKAFIREYNYKASETDSKVSSRQKALTEVKALLIEELGTYVESYVNYQIEDKNKRITKDFFTSEIKTLSAGTLETKIIAENWNGYEYYVKAEIVADPEEVLRRINETLSKRKSSELIDSLHLLLEGSKKDFDSKSKELEQIRAQLVKQNADVESKQKSLNLLSQQLAKTKQELAGYQAQETRMLSEIEAIEQKMKTAASVAVANVRIGMTHEEVVRVCGKPRAEACFNMNYGSVWVIFASDIVVGMVEASDFQSCTSMESYKRQGSRIVLK